MTIPVTVRQPITGGPTPAIIDIGGAFRIELTEAEDLLDDLRAAMSLANRLNAHELNNGIRP